MTCIRSVILGLGLTLMLTSSASAQQEQKPKKGAGGPLAELTQLLPAVLGEKLNLSE